MSDFYDPESPTRCESGPASPNGGLPPDLDSIPLPPPAPAPANTLTLTPKDTGNRPCDADLAIQTRSQLSQSNALSVTSPPPASPSKTDELLHKSPKSRKTIVPPVQDLKRHIVTRSQRQIPLIEANSGEESEDSKSDRKIKICFSIKSKRLTPLVQYSDDDSIMSEADPHGSSADAAAAAAASGDGVAMTIEQPATMVESYVAEVSNSDPACVEKSESRTSVLSKGILGEIVSDSSVKSEPHHVTVESGIASHVKADVKEYISESRKAKRRRGSRFDQPSPADDPAPPTAVLESVDVAVAQEMNMSPEQKTLRSQKSTDQTMGIDDGTPVLSGEGGSHVNSHVSGEGGSHVNSHVSGEGGSHVNSHVSITSLVPHQLTSAVLKANALTPKRSIPQSMESIESQCPDELLVEVKSHGDQEASLPIATTSSSSSQEPAVVEIPESSAKVAGKHKVSPKLGSLHQILAPAAFGMTTKQLKQTLEEELRQVEEEIRVQEWRKKREKQKSDKNESHDPDTSGLSLYSDEELDGDPEAAMNVTEKETRNADVIDSQSDVNSERVVLGTPLPVIEKIERIKVKSSEASGVQPVGHVTMDSSVESLQQVRGRELNEGARGKRKRTWGSTPPREEADITRAIPGSENKVLNESIDSNTSDRPRSLDKGNQSMDRTWESDLSKEATLESSEAERLQERSVEGEVVSFDLSRDEKPEERPSSRDRTPERKHSDDRSRDRKIPSRERSVDKSSKGNNRSRDRKSRERDRRSRERRSKERDRGRDRRSPNWDKERRSRERRSRERKSRENKSRERDQRHRRSRERSRDRNSRERLSVERTRDGNRRSRDRRSRERSRDKRSRERSVGQRSIDRSRDRKSIERSRGRRSRERRSRERSKEKRSADKSRERRSMDRLRDRRSRERSRGKRSVERSKERRSLDRSRDNRSLDRSREKKSMDRNRDRRSPDRLGDKRSRDRRSMDRSRDRRSMDRSRDRRSMERSRDRRSVERSRDRRSRERKSRERSRERRRSHERTGDKNMRSRDRQSRERSRDRERSGKDREGERGHSDGVMSQGWSQQHGKHGGSRMERDNSFQNRPLLASSPKRTSYGDRKIGSLENPLHAFPDPMSGQLPPLKNSNYTEKQDAPELDNIPLPPPDMVSSEFPYSGVPHDSVPPYTNSGTNQRRILLPTPQFQLPMIGQGRDMPVAPPPIGGAEFMPDFSSPPPNYLNQSLAIHGGALPSMPSFVPPPPPIVVSHTVPPLSHQAPPLSHQAPPLSHHQLPPPPSIMSNLMPNSHGDHNSLLSPPQPSHLIPPPPSGHTPFVSSLPPPPMDLPPSSISLTQPLNTIMMTDSTNMENVDMELECMSDKIKDTGGSGTPTQDEKPILSIVSHQRNQATTPRVAFAMKMGGVKGKSVSKPLSVFEEEDKVKRLPRIDLGEDSHKGGGVNLDVAAGVYGDADTTCNQSTVSPSSAAKLHVSGPLQDTNAAETPSPSQSSRVNLISITPQAATEIAPPLMIGQGCQQDGVLSQQSYSVGADVEASIAHLSTPTSSELPLGSGVSMQGVGIGSLSAGEPIGEEVGYIDKFKRHIWQKKANERKADGEPMEACMSSLNRPSSMGEASKEEEEMRRVTPSKRRRSSRIKTREERRNKDSDGGSKSDEVDEVSAVSAESPLPDSKDIAETGVAETNKQQALDDAGLFSPPLKHPPDDLTSPSAKPIKVKSRWRRWSELEITSSSSEAHATSEFSSPEPQKPDPTCFTTPPPPPPIPHQTPTSFSTPDKASKSPISSAQEIMALAKRKTVSLMADTLSEDEVKVQEAEEETEPPAFDAIFDNIYLQENRKRTKARKEARRMVCDCVAPGQDDIVGGKACGEDCLNRMLMVECGSRCPCGELCSNKRFQRHQYAETEVFRTHWKGWGLKTCRDIRKGTFVLEYVGEVCGYNEFHSRSRLYAKESQKHFYFMALNADEIIDATKRGNISRFINHSCEPNCETQKWTVNGQLRVGFFTMCDVKQGEELTFDYQFEQYGKEAQKCFCGAEQCRGTIGKQGESRDSEEEEEEEEEENEGEEEEKKPAAKKKIFDDVILDEALEKLGGEGMRTRSQVLEVARLMVRAESMQQRTQLLVFIQATREPACLRLFLDYHGLSLLWSWMLDINNSALTLKVEVLKTLKALPISNRTILNDSKVLSVVERWSRELPSTTTAPNPVTTESDRSSQERESEACSTPRASGEPPSEVSTPETPLPHKKQRLLQRLTAAEEASSSDGETWEKAGIVSKDTDSEMKSLLEEYQGLLEQLLSSWSELKEMFKIPKIQVVQERKRTEQELDSRIGQGERKVLPDVQEHRKRGYEEPDWVQRARDDKRRRQGGDEGDDRGAKTRMKVVDWLSNKHNQTSPQRVGVFLRGGSTPNKLSKHERRQQFEAKVRAEEQQKAREQQDQGGGGESYFSGLSDGQANLVSHNPPSSNTLAPQALGLQGLSQQGLSQQGLSQQGLPQQELSQQALSQQELPQQELSQQAMAAGALQYYEQPGESSGAPPQQLLLSPDPAPTHHILESTKPHYIDPNTPHLVLQQGHTSFQTSAGGPSLQQQYEAAAAQYLNGSQGAPAAQLVQTAQGQLYYTTSQQPQPPPQQQPTGSAPASQLLLQHLHPRPQTFPHPVLQLIQADVTPVSVSQQLASSSHHPVQHHIQQQQQQSQQHLSSMQTQQQQLLPTAASQVIPPQLPNPTSTTLTTPHRDPREPPPPPPSPPPKPKQPRLPPNWKIARDGDNKAYYYHTVTRQTQWEAPSWDTGGDDSDSMDLGTPSGEDDQWRQKTTTAAADTSSENAKKIKDQFRSKIAKHIVTCLGPFRKPDCKMGKITTTEDFKHLARKITHAVLDKELKYCRHLEDLEVNENVKGKAKDYVKKYMSRFGAIYRKTGSP